MARMYPRTLLDADVKTDSERKVFELLRDELPDEWEGFHSASWIDRDPFEGARDGEIDFVLCRADLPVVCLEVKGGGIECRYGEWFRMEPGGKRERIPSAKLSTTDTTSSVCWRRRPAGRDARR
jgi:hypothetical protein